MLHRLPLGQAIRSHSLQIGVLASMARPLRPQMARMFHFSSPAGNIDIESVNPIKHELKANQIVKVRTQNSWFADKPLDEKFRKGHSPLYESPGMQMVATAKRVTLGFGLAGLYFSKLMLDTGLFALPASTTLAVVSIIPFPLVIYLFSPYVSRIYRLYDDTKPQTLENLAQNETLVMEKINWSGRKAFNELVLVKDLQITGPSTWYNWPNWKALDPETGKPRYYYVTDHVGGLRMDRIWGIAERQSGVDNGRSF
ncbi:BA75_00653T0 [Komagataella pastoris]|uniref:BA75_00653T0 n=1 Tax=Komagataella pastoris TaxID=4922 RepID=A0A1B2J6A5_PICPA|nr:BA75_00653T0 [Komagataella pastoris]